MRELVVNTFLTLDGVMQAPGGPEEDPTGSFTHGGWSATYWDDFMMQTMGEAMAEPFALLLGRKTYEIFAALAVRHRGPFRGQAQQRNEVRRLQDARRGHVEQLGPPGGDAAEAVVTLKQESGPEIQVHGSSGLIQTLLEHDLVDDYRLWIFPLVLGTGKRLFAGGTVPRGLKLVDSKISTTGVVIATYEPAGEIEYGSFALEEPTE